MRLNDQNNSIGDIAEALGLSKSTVCLTVRKQELTGSVVDDRRVLLL